MQVTVNHNIRVVLRFDEPVRVQPTSKAWARDPVAARTVAVEVSRGRASVSVDGFAYRSDGTVGKSPRKQRFLALSDLPEEVVKAVREAYWEYVNAGIPTEIPQEG